MLWAPRRGQLSGQDLAVLLKAVALEKRDPAAAEAMVRAQVEPRVQEEEAARAVLWAKVDIDREAELERLETILARPRGD
jgi:hypothetical protein